MKLEQVGPERFEDLLPLVRGYHAFEGINMPETARRKAVAPLLEDPGLGSVWVIIESGEWIGYVALTYGYSIEFGGRDAFIDELFILEEWRGRGFGTRVLEAVKTQARKTGIRALHLEVDRENRAAQGLYDKLGFELRERFSLMSVKL